MLRELKKVLNGENLLIFAVLAVAFLVRVYDLGKMNLFQDEAYYWDWSRHLSFGYFSHPPLVAWAIFLGKNIFGQTEAGLRLSFVLFGIISILAVYKLAISLFNKTVAQLILLTISVSPPYVLASRLATPDILAVLFWVLCCLFFWEAYKFGGKKNFFLFGMSLGLSLLSKLHSYFLLVSVLLFLTLNSDKKTLIKYKNFYFSLLIALAVILPNIIWNSFHRWSTYLFPYFQDTKVSFPSGISLGAAFANLALSIKDLSVIMDPLILPAVLSSVPIFIYWGVVKKNDAVKLCFFIFAPITIFFSIFSGQKHWAFPGYFAAYLMLIFFIEKVIKDKKVVILLGIFIFLLNLSSSLYLIKSLTAENPNPKIKNSTYAILYRFTNNEKADVYKLSEAIGYNGKQSIVAENWFLASEFSYYFPGRPQISAPNGQYLLWGPPKKWENVIAIAQAPSFFKGVSPKYIQTAKLSFYYFDFGNNPPTLNKDWSWNLDGP